MSIGDQSTQNLIQRDHQILFQTNLRRYSLNNNQKCQFVNLLRLHIGGKENDKVHKSLQITGKPSSKSRKNLWDSKHNWIKTFPNQFQDRIRDKPAKKFKNIKYLLPPLKTRLLATTALTRLNTSRLVYDMISSRSPWAEKWSKWQPLPTLPNPYRNPNRLSERFS